MDYLFIKNPSGSDSNGLQIKDPNGSFTNTGPDGSVVIADQRVGICLSPQTNIPLVAGEVQSPPVGMEGDFVVEVDGHVVPYFFKEGELPNYFDKDNTFGFGIEFVKVVEPPPVGTSFTFDLERSESNVGNILNNGTETITLIWPDGSREELVSKAFTTPDAKYVGQGPLQCTIVHAQRGNLKLTHESIISVDSWSPSGYEALELGSKRLVSVPDTAPPLLTNYNTLFRGAELLNDPNISNWDTTIATTMIMTFHNTPTLNQPLNWNTVNVVSMNAMFTSTVQSTIAFAQDLSHWRVKKIATRPNGWDSPQYGKIVQPYWGIDPVEETDGMVIYTALPSESLGIQVTVKSNAVVHVDWGDGTSATTDPNVNGGAVWNNDYPLHDDPKAKIYQITITSDDPETTQHSLAVTGGIMKVRKWMDKSFASIRFSDEDSIHTQLVSVPDHAPPGINSVLDMFRMNVKFNDPNVAKWDYRWINNMDGYLQNTSQFSQDLAKICVPLILSEPTNFAINSKMTPEKMPVWGTCPVP